MFGVCLCFGGMCGCVVCLVSVVWPECFLFYSFFLIGEMFRLAVSFV